MLAVSVNMSHFYQNSTRVTKSILGSVALLLASMPLIEVRAAEFIQLEIGDQSYRIELALTSSERRQGLMQRNSLDRYGGMLLVYRQPGDHRIWMKNMRIPLRVYWIDSDFEVISMQRLEPCQSNPCPVFSATKPSSYILELSDDEHELRPGDRIEGLKDL
ncbi:MAG: DUF192 domain-containing protein [Gammaproteobacteria bacterium]|nr:MAG: DUF192 domain-containing protein [Gammaproteobacteria bacterium]